MALPSIPAVQLAAAFAFEGHITATLTRAGDTQTWRYTFGTNQLRIEAPKAPPRRPAFQVLTARTRPS